MEEQTPDLSLCTELEVEGVCPMWASPPPDTPSLWGLRAPREHDRGTVSPLSRRLKDVTVTEPVSPLISMLPWSQQYRVLRSAA